MENSTSFKLSTPLAGSIIFAGFSISSLFIPVQFSKSIQSLQHISLADINLNDAGVLFGAAVTLTIAALVPVISYAIISASKKPLAAASIFVVSMMLVNTLYYRFNIFENNISIIPSVYYYFFNILTAAGVAAKAWALLSENSVKEEKFKNSPSMA